MSRNRTRTKDPRGGYRVGKSAKKDTARAIRHQAIPEPEALPRVKTKKPKNTKQWCKGRVGREHTVVVRNDRKWYSARWIRVCATCSKELEVWYETSWSRTRHIKPDWVKEEEARAKSHESGH